MARPKAEFPRSERLVSRLTVAEAEQVRTSAEAAGLTIADFVRQRCGLDPAVVVTVENVRRWNPGAKPLDVVPPSWPDEMSATAAELANEARPKHGRPQMAWDRHQQNEARKLAWFCPTPLCQEHGAKGARCPEHGVAMDVRGRA